jgi:hypothetical protein
LGQRSLRKTTLGTQAAQAHAHECLGHFTPIPDAKDSQNLQIHAITFASIHQFRSIRMKSKCVDCEVSQTSKPALHIQRTTMSTVTDATPNRHAHAAASFKPKNPSPSPA